MNLQICAVYDSAAEVFGRPFFVPSTGVAIRSFRDEINNPDSAMCKHPDDYTLYNLGRFDDSMGGFDVHTPEALLRGKDAVVTKE